MSDPTPPHGPSDPEWLALLDDDERAARALAAALDETDPPPAWVDATADIAWATRDLDSALAELVRDEALSGAARAGTPTDGRALSFAAGEHRVDVTIRADRDGVYVTGSVDPVLPPDAHLAWEGVAGTGSVLALSAEGHFAADLPLRARIRLRLRIPGAVSEQVLVTPWFLPE